MLEKVKEARSYLKNRSEVKPKAGVILGSGLGDFINTISNAIVIPYSDIPNFPVSSVEGHEGNLIFGYLKDVPIVALQGRLHIYEGHDVKDTVFPIRVMHALGIELLVLSNASGGLHPEFKVGDIMLIEDHINLSGENPLIGKNDHKIGDRFPDMSEPYDKRHRNHALRIAREKGIPLQKGVYASVKGPNYETPAEYNYLRIIGADAVGMSTVHEVITARHMKLSCLAFSVISDLGVKGKIKAITHDEVLMEASKAEPQLASILLDLIPAIFQE